MLSPDWKRWGRCGLAGLTAGLMVVAGCTGENGETAAGKPDLDPYAVKKEASPETAKDGGEEKAPAEAQRASPSPQPAEERAAAEMQPESAQTAELAAGSAQTGAASSEKQKTGERVYKQACMACHKMGVAGAPKLGETEKWKERAEKGKDVLFEHVKNGFKAMPLKGGCPQCTDAELQAGIDYMLDQSL